MQFDSMIRAIGRQCDHRRWEGKVSGESYPEGVPKELHVVVTQRGDPTDDRVWDNVGRIQSAAQPHLQDHHVYPLFNEHFQPCISTGWIPVAKGHAYPANCLHRPWSQMESLGTHDRSW